LARRAWVVNQLKARYPETPMALLDSGNFSDNPTPAGDLKTAGLLQAMKRLGYGVINVGERDIRLGYPEFERRTEGADFEFISANIIDRDSKSTVFKPHTVIEAVSPDGETTRRIGVIGVVRFNPVFLKAGPDGGNISIARPLGRVKKQVEVLKKKKVDTIVLLAAMHKNDATAIANEVPEIEFVLGSYGGLITNNAEEVGEASMVYVGNRGQRIAEMRLFMDDKGKSVERSDTKVHMLSRAYPPHHPMLDYVNALPREPGDLAPSGNSGP